jgi:hypothetical protein
MRSMIPKAAKKIALRPLALGEKTGHHHSLYVEPGGVALEDAAELFEVTTHDGVKHFLRISAEGVSLQHQEHKTHAVPPGEYEVVIQTEVTDWGRSQVID